MVHVMLLLVAIFSFIQIIVGDTQQCKAKVDIGFLLDSSGSLRSEYQKEKDFVKALTDKFDIGAGSARASLIAFSHEAEHSIKLSEHTTKKAFNEAVDAIPIMGSETRIDLALRLADKELFTISNGARTGARKLLILLTDGAQSSASNSEDPSTIADELRQTGVELIVIGIGNHVMEEELDKLAGGSGKAVRAKSFNELISSEFINHLTDKACEVVDGKQPDCCNLVPKVDSIEKLIATQKTKIDFNQKLINGFSMQIYMLSKMFESNQKQSKKVESNEKSVNTLTVNMDGNKELIARLSSRLSKEVGKCKQDNRELTDRMDFFNQSIKAVSSKQSATEQRIIAADDNLRKIIQDKKKLTHRLNSYDQLVKAVSSKQSASEQRISATDYKLGMSIQDNRELKSRVDAISSKQSATRQRITAIDEKLVKITQDSRRMMMQDIDSRANNTTKKIQLMKSAADRKMDLMKATIDTLTKQVDQLKTHGIIDQIHPIGSLYLSFSSVSPPMNGQHGVRWEKLPEGYALMTANKGNSGTTSGKNRLDKDTTEGHVLTVEQMPRHSHKYYHKWFDYDNKYARTSTVFDSVHIQNHIPREEHYIDGEKAGGDKAHNHRLNVLNAKILVWKRTA